MSLPDNWPADCESCPKCGAEQRYEYPNSSTVPQGVPRWKRMWRARFVYDPPIGDALYPVAPERMEHSCTTCGYTVTTKCLDAKP